MTTLSRTQTGQQIPLTTSSTTGKRPIFNSPQFGGMAIMADQIKLYRPSFIEHVKAFFTKNPLHQSGGLGLSEEYTFPLYGHDMVLIENDQKIQAAEDAIKAMDNFKVKDCIIDLLAYLQENHARLGLDPQAISQLFAQVNEKPHRDFFPKNEKGVRDPRGTVTLDVSV